MSAATEGEACAYDVTEASAQVGVGAEPPGAEGSSEEEEEGFWLPST
jgi:hypothetical protein